MTGIRTVELSQPLQPIDGVAAYSRCMVVMRWHGQVVGRAFVPVVDGRVPREALEALAGGAAGVEAIQVWLNERLNHDGRAVVGAIQPAATIAICTRERPDDLRHTLHAVAAFSAGPRDVLVVDNAPATDTTRSVVNEFPGVRYVLEPRRGLNVARNRALREAREDIVAFTDDDAAPEPAWVDALCRNLQDRRIVCVTGLTLPRELDTPAQELFEEHCPFARGFHRRVFDGVTDNPLAVGPVGAGANMAVRRRVVLDLGGFDERLDAGMPTRSGGDHEIFVRMLTRGHQIAYDPAAVSWHRHRRTERELFDTVYGYGVGMCAMWTGLLLERRELGVLRIAWQSFQNDYRSVLLARRPATGDRDALRRAELRGCTHGPRAWLHARRLRAGEV